MDQANKSMGSTTAENKPRLKMNWQEDPKANQDAAAKLESAKAENKPRLKTNMARKLRGKSGRGTGGRGAIRRERQ